jgi:pyridoxal phosphate enzyme (YggS family)
MTEKRETIDSNLAAVRQRLAAAARRAGRSAEEITLVAVTKTVPLLAILIAYELGLRDFGENRVQEAEAKIAGARPQAADLRWHLVGHLQTNKAKAAVELFDFIQSVDSLHLAEALDRRAQAVGRRLPVLLEVNVSGETSKSGFAVAGTGPAAPGEALLPAVERLLALPHLDVQGLMTIAPLVSDPEQARPYFRALRELRDELQQRFPQTNWRHLSMGMTDDFEVAVEEGATMVRIGRAIFGER